MTESSGPRLTRRPSRRCRDEVAGADLAGPKVAARRSELGAIARRAAYAVAADGRRDAARPSAGRLAEGPARRPGPPTAVARATTSPIAITTTSITIHIYFNITYFNITYFNITYFNITYFNITYFNITYFNITYFNITYFNITYFNITYFNITNPSATPQAVEGGAAVAVDVTALGSAGRRPGGGSR
ncbi:hypothetical protein [Antribacter gilvus]|uniref:hypothetical protein n=1 Tax=Antribacter gilvus TaxID=2304675 RepID=UPI0013DF0DFF|nr:hypothetical protein [Antribacter gilvus]